jgi:hypothetical protein
VDFSILIPKISRESTIESLETALRHFIRKSIVYRRRSEILRFSLPTPIIAAIRTVLTAHNTLEEGPGGVYDRCEQLAGAEADALLSQLHAAPEVPVAPYADGPQVMSVVRRALERAGYDIELGE